MQHALQRAPPRALQRALNKRLSNEHMINCLPRSPLGVRFQMYLLLTCWFWVLSTDPTLR